MGVGELGKTSGKPWVGFHVGNHPGAYNDEYHQEDDSFFTVVPHAASVVQVYAFVYHNDGGMGYKVDHGVLAYVVDKGDAFYVETQKYTGESAEGEGGGEGDNEGSFESIQEGGGDVGYSAPAVL